MDVAECQLLTSVSGGSLYDVIAEILGGHLSLGESISAARVHDSSGNNER